MSILPNIFASNAAFAERISLGELPLPSAIQAAILTCMNARIDAHALSWLGIRNTPIIRNAIRSLEQSVRDDAARSPLVNNAVAGDGLIYGVRSDRLSMVE